WKLEGVEISNPNHFADLAVFGGGGITALSSQLMTNSDFFTGAMPAEYQNALSGVFDLYMRNGNARKREHTFQLGLIGIDAASEGPFIQGKKASYLFNYRYATLGLLAPLLPENASGTQYQDLSFKLHFPTMKMGTLSVWGLGLIDHSNARSRSDVSEWKYRSDRENQDVNQYMGTAGITHKISIKSGQLLKTTVACNSNGIEMVTDRLDSNGSISHTSRVKNGYETITLSSVLNTRISHRHSNRSGILIQSVFYDLLQRNQPLQNSVSTTTIQQNGNSGLISAFSSSKIQWKDRIQGIAGFTISWFLLNHHVSLEPRGSVTYTLNKRQRISVGYGLHSRMERLNYYFIRDTQHQLVNRDLGFSKAHHWVAGYDFTPSDVTHFKLEFYLQSLFQVPVIDDSSFSLLNQQNDWFFGSALRNKGKGRNIGIDISFEKYLSKGYYYSGSLSLFSSRYQGGDGLWRSTRYNRNLALNMLIGKEWIFGRNKNKVMGLNLRCNVQGGEHYSPVDAVRSVSAEEVIFDESRAYSKQYAPSFSTHLTASYKVNKKNSSHELALKILNLNQYREYSGFRYNYVSQQVEVIREALFIPNLSYKIEF
ncbi:MAG TPA: hypothetical protein PLP14_05095, partial [Chitinophagaceae bacterium]|nr:hypothetical protein [Chitinophagaceae bacterium]